MLTHHVLVTPIGAATHIYGGLLFSASHQFLPSGHTEIGSGPDGLTAHG